ncbi:MAG: ABC transporter permease, partial [Acidimicrobiales bacterium]
MTYAAPGLSNSNLPISVSEQPDVVIFGLRRTFIDAAVLAQRNIAKTLREPESLLDVTVIPIIFTLLFA